MPFAIASAFNGSALAATSLVINLGTVASGNQVMVAIRSIGVTFNPIPIVTDDQLNSYQELFSIGQNTTTLIGFWAENVTGGSPLTLTITTSSPADLYANGIVVQGLVTPSAIEDASFQGYTIGDGFGPSSSFDSSLEPGGGTAHLVVSTTTNDVVFGFMIPATPTNVPTETNGFTTVNVNQNIGIAYKEVGLGAFKSTWTTVSLENIAIIDASTWIISGVIPPVVVFKPIVYIT